MSVCPLTADRRPNSLRLRPLTELRRPYYKGTYNEVAMFSVNNAVKLD